MGPVITRVLNAPRDKVWQAFTEAEQIKKWWGPKDFTAPMAKIDLRAGGSYLFCMRGAIPGNEVKDFYSGGEIKQVVPNEKIVLIDCFTDKDGNRVSPETYGLGDFPGEREVTVTFEDAGEGKTKLTISYDKDIPAEHKRNMVLGWNESLDKLERAVS